MALDRPALRRTRGLGFAKLMGTGSGRTFTLRDSDLRHWALLTTWADPGARSASTPRSSWRGGIGAPKSTGGPTSRRSSPAGRGPAASPSATRPPRSDGPVAAITRARLVPRRALAFWRAVPPVSTDLRQVPGLRFALGIGEAPLGLQGTFSVWDDASALQAFAYGRAAHARSSSDTARLGWYSEELFARFRVVGTSGSYAGRDPLGSHLPR